MPKPFGKLICAVKGYHNVEIGNKEEAQEWMKTIEDAVHDNGFAMLRCNICGQIVALVHDNEETTM